MAIVSGNEHRGRSAVSRTILFALICLLIALSSSVFAQDSVTLTFPDGTPRYAWVQDGYPAAAPTDATKVLSASTQLLVPAKTKDTQVFVWDQSAGLIANRKFSDIKNGSWDVKPADFTNAAEVRVSVDHDEKPVSAASVSLTAGGRTQSQVLDSSANGVVSFFLVPAGKASVSVQYRTTGGMAKPVEQVFTIDAKPGQAVPVLQVSLPEQTQTIGAPAAATGPGPTDQAATAPVKPDNQVHSSPFGTFLVWLITLGVVLVAGYFGMQFLKGHPDQVRRTLEQLGAQIPKPADEQLNEAIPAVPLQAPAPPAPVQKIMLGDAGPDPLVSAAYVPSASPTAVSSPRLRAASGDTIALSDSQFIVGRDPGLGLSLTGEASVSRRHAEIDLRPEGVVVRDLGSTNGTWVNGARLQSDVVLRPGDEVRFGSVGFRFES